MDRPVPVCRDNAVAGRASRDFGDLLAVLVVPLKERLAPVSAGRIGQRDGIALNRVRRGVGTGGLAVVVYILNGVLNGRKFAVELPFLGHVQLFDLSFYANISWFLIPAAEFVTIFCIRSPQAVGGIVNRVNRVHLLFYPRTGFIREVVLDCERLLFPVRVQVRPAVDGLAGDVRGLAFAAPEGEGVAVAGRSGRVCGGQSRANAGLGGTEDALRLGVVVLICRQRFQRIEVNDRNQLGDDELEILPVSGDQQLLQSGGFILQTVQIPLVAVEHAVVVPAAVDLEVEIEIAARIDLRKVNRIASKLIGGVRNIHDRLAQIAGLEDHEVDVGLFGFPLRNIGHSLRDRCRNFGLPACEGVAGAGRGAVERGGRGILPKVRIDLIGENLFTIYAVGVGNGIFLRHMYAALRLDLPAAPGPDQRDRNDLLIVLDLFQVLERRVELGHIAFGVIADVAKPVVPFLPRLEDEVVYIALAEQTVGGRMLLRSIYDALDLNSHFKLFQLVSRRGFGLADDFNDRQVTPLLPFPVPVNSCFGVIAEGDGQRCVLLVNEPMLDAGGLVICHQIRRYRDRRGDVVALLVLLHIADRILRRGGNIIRLVSMCCFVVLADDSKTAVQRRGLCGRGHFVRGFDPRVRCRFHPRLTIFIIGEVERDGLRGRGVLHLPDQIAGLLHEPCRPDSHRADISARAIAYDLADRMLCVGRVSERILYRIMRSGCRNADNIYNNAGHVVFRGLGGLVGGWGVRLPDGVESGGRGGCCNPITRLNGGRCCVRFPIPAEEVVAFSGRNRAGNGERHRVGAWHVGDEIRRVGVVGQGVGDGGGNSLLRNQVNRIRCLRSSRTGGVEVKNCGVLLGLFRPANEFIARIQLAFQRRNADISELADQNRMIEARMACAILACIGLINRRAIVIANVELIADIKNLVLDCLCFIRFQRLRTDTVVSRKGRHRQHAEHHNQN